MAPTTPPADTIESETILIINSAAGTLACVDNMGGQAALDAFRPNSSSCGIGAFPRTPRRLRLRLRLWLVRPLLWRRLGSLLPRLLLL